MQFTLVELWAHMGIAARLIALTMVAMSVVSLLVSCERLLVLRSGQKQSLRFAERLSQLLTAAGGVDAAVDGCVKEGEESSVGPLGRVLRAGLSAYRGAPKSDEDFAFEAVARALERQAQREAHTMKRGIGVLATVSSTAPFVGLLGTVLGIVNSFQMMATTGSGGLSAVSSGIAEALATTALGLLVALPAIGAYNGLTATVEARVLDISEASNELLDRIALHLRTLASQQRSNAPRSLRPVPNPVEKK